MKKIKIDKGVIKVHIILIIISIIFISTLVLSGYSVERINNFESNLKSSIEQQKRSDARQLLNDVVDRFDSAIKNGSVDPKSIESVNNWANYNFNGLRNGSPTSNGFIIELGEETYISDSSIDYNIIYSGSKKTMDSFVDRYKNNSTEIQAAFNRMKLGIDTAYGDNISCTINGQREWLEWCNYPTTISVGIDGEPYYKAGSKNDN